ncbi:MAG: hypothetical protein ACREQN_15880 [Candidatus Binataceae bacterium]
MDQFAEALFELLPGNLGLLWVEMPPQARILILMGMAAALAWGALKVEQNLFKAIFAAGSGLIFTYIIVTALNFH